MKRWLPLILTLVLSGCITSTSPIHTESSKVTDNRFLGSFEGKGMTARVNEHPTKEGHYKVVTSIKEEWVELDAVLFKIEDRVYVELIKTKADVGKPSQGVYTGPQWVNRILKDEAYNVFGIEISDEYFTLFGSGSQELKKFLQTYEPSNGTISESDELVSLKSTPDDAQRIIHDARTDHGLFRFPIVFRRD